MMTVGDVDQTLCKQKETVLPLYVPNGRKNTLNRLLDLPYAANKVRTFRNYHLCLFQLNMGQVMWRMLKYMGNQSIDI